MRKPLELHRIEDNRVNLITLNAWRNGQNLECNMLMKIGNMNLKMAFGMHCIFVQILYFPRM